MTITNIFYGDCLYISKNKKNKCIPSHFLTSTGMLLFVVIGCDTKKSTMASPTPVSDTHSDDCTATANIVLIGAGWWSQGWHLPHLHRNEKVTISAIVGEFRGEKWCFRVVDQAHSRVILYIILFFHRTRFFRLLSPSQIKLESESRIIRISCSTLPLSSVPFPFQAIIRQINRSNYRRCHRVHSPFNSFRYWKTIDCRGTTSVRGGNSIKGGK